MKLVLKDPRVFQELREMKDLGGHQEFPDFQDCKGYQDLKEARVTVVIQAREGLQDHQAHKVPQVPQELKERQELLVHQELKDQEVLKVILDCQV